MASADLEALPNALSSGRRMKVYRPENPEAEAAKIVRLRKLRLAKEAMENPPRAKPRPVLIVTR
jgi:hypothetical protein